MKLIKISVISILAITTVIGCNSRQRAFDKGIADAMKAKSKVAITQTDQQKLTARLSDVVRILMISRKTEKGFSGQAVLNAHSGNVKVNSNISDELLKGLVGSSDQNKKALEQINQIASGTILKLNKTDRSKTVLKTATLALRGNSDVEAAAETLKEGELLIKAEDFSTNLGAL